jgi:hypothetical protein
MVFEYKPDEIDWSAFWEKMVFEYVPGKIDWAAAWTEQASPPVVIVQVSHPEPLEEQAIVASSLFGVGSDSQSRG